MFRAAMFYACNAGRLPGLVWGVNHVPPSTATGSFRWAMADEGVAPPESLRAGEAEEVELLRQAAGGSPEAWQDLFDRWKKPLLAFFYRSLGSWAAAEDLTLEVFVRLHRTAPRFEPRGSVAALVFRIARNLLLNELRRRRRKPADLLPPEAFDYFPAPGDDGNARAAEHEENFQRALALLPEHQRTLLLLVHQQHLAVGEVATLLGVTPNAARVQLHRAREQLKEILRSLLP